MDLDQLAIQDEALPREAYALLAQANLLRMRGCWEEAAEKCMAALRLAPDSASANSLLGDIYENQGRYDDAAQWYRMALDVNPDSPADRIKLDHLRRREEMQRERVAVNLPVSRDSMTREMPRLSLRAAARLARPEAVLRGAAAAAALVLVLIVALAYRAVHHPAALAAFGLGGETVVQSKPLVVPPQAGALPMDPDGAPARDPAEQSLLTALQASPDLSRAGVAVYDVQVDPRAGRTVVTFGLPSSPKPAHGDIPRAALRVLQAAAAGQAAQTFTARCLLVPTAGKADATLAFIGDAAREAVLGAGDAGSLADAQAEANFSNVWWSLTADVRA